MPPLRAKTGVMSSSRPALFLDRDGVINVDKGYVSRIEDFEWVDGAAETISSFNKMGWFVFVVTNQSGIARNYYSEDDMNVLHQWMQEELRAKDANIDRIYFCPFHADGENFFYRRDSFDRKPNPGMLLKAMADFPVKRESSFLIGDKATDIEAARAAGIAGYLFRGGNLKNFADWTLASFEDGNRG